MTTTLHPAPGGRHLVAAVAALTVPVAVALMLLAGVGALSPPETTGLPEPGPITRWGLPVTRALREISASVVIGGLLVAATVLAARNARGRLSPGQESLLRLVAAAALLWSCVGFAELVLVYSDLSAQPPLAEGLTPVFFFVNDVEVGRAMALSALIAGAIGFFATVVRRLGGVALLALASVAALWAVATTGHAAGTVDHDIGVTTQFFHTGGAGAWVGGLLALVWVRRMGALEPVVLARFSRFAGWAWLVVAVSGVVAALIRVRDIEALQGHYGLMLAAKVGALLALGLFGYAHRRWSLSSPSGGSRPFARLFAGEAVLMLATVGIAVALSRTDPPEIEVEALDTATALLGFAMPPELGTAEWFTQWRFDPLWGSLAIVMLGSYAAGVWRLRRRGDHWSWGRLIAWTVGCLGLLWATSGAPGVYGKVLFSMHMVQHMIVATAVPMFLVLGAPATLGLRALRRRSDGSRGPREWLLAVLQSRVVHLLGHPVVAAFIFIVGMVAFYYSSLFELSLRTHTGHMLMMGHFLLAGYLFANAICGADPGPARPPHPFRMLLILVTFGFHAFFAVSLMASDVILAEQWFESLGRSWGNSLERDQYIGAQLAWALGDYPIAILAGGLIVNWVRADHREARRLDRQADRDGDRELAAYNEYLRTIDATHRHPHAGGRAGSHGP